MNALRNSSHVLGHAGGAGVGFGFFGGVIARYLRFFTMVVLPPQKRGSVERCNDVGAHLGQQLIRWPLRPQRQTQRCSSGRCVAAPQPAHTT
jgi:hypothetical protein